jgi:hypothetical protein
MRQYIDDNKAALFHDAIQLCLYCTAKNWIRFPLYSAKNVAEKNK